MISKEVKNKIISVLILTGIFGNIICIIVFGSILFVSYRTLKKNPLSNILNQKFNWYLLFLAIADIIFLTLIYIQRNITDLPNYSEYFCYSIDIIFESLKYFGVFLNLILSIDRLNSVIRPVQHKEFVTQKFPKLVSLITVGITISINLLSFIRNIPEYDPSASFKCLNLPSIFTIYIMFLIVIMLLVTVILNIGLFCALCSNLKKRSNRSTISYSIAIRSGAAKQKSHISHNLVIIFVNLIDFPFYFFVICFNNCNYFDLEHEKEFIIAIFQILGQSVNVFVYLLFHKRFRQTFFKPFCMIIQLLCKDKRKETCQNKSNRQSQTREKKSVKNIISYPKSNVYLKQHTRIIVI